MRMKMEFRNKLDNLFDVAHPKALTILTNPQVILFLLQQRESGRPGEMIVIQEHSVAVPEQPEHVMQKEQKRKKRAEVRQKQLQKWEHEKQNNGNL